MFGNQNRTLRQRASTAVATGKSTTAGGLTLAKRAILGEIKNNKSTSGKDTAHGKDTAAPGALQKKASVQATTLIRTRKSLSGIQQQKQVSNTTTTTQIQKQQSSVHPVPKQKPVPTDRKTRSSKPSSATSSQADTKSTTTAAAVPKRKSRTSMAAAAAPSVVEMAAAIDLASDVEHAAAASKKAPTAAKPTTTAKPAVSRQTSAIAKPAAVKSKLEPKSVNESAAAVVSKKVSSEAVAVKQDAKAIKRTSRKNSRTDDIEEERIVAKNHASKKARTLPHDDLDKDDFADPMMVTEYVEEIFEYLRELEVESMPNPNYMDNQKELQWKMRGILVDWLIEVHTKFRLLPETLFLAVNLIDRFLSLRVVSLVKLQLVGVTALFIASKYEEVMSPSIQSFLYMAEDGYTETEIIRAERYMLQVLKFNMQYPTPLSFLRRSSKADDYDIQTRTLAKYLMEITLLDHKFLPYTASIIASSAHYLARHMLDRGDWNKNLVYYSGYTASDLSAPVAQMLHFLSCPTKFQAIYKKYSQRKFMKGSSFVADWISSRKSVGLHPVYDHEMNVSARAEWISKRDLKVEGSSVVGCEDCGGECGCNGESEANVDSEDSDSSDGFC